MKRAKLIERIQEHQRKKQNIGIWYTLHGIPHFISSQIEAINILGIQLAGGYFLHFEGDVTTIEEISCQGRTIYKRGDIKPRRKKEKTSIYKS